MARKFKVVKPRSISVSSLRMGPYYTVASVELGNTTTKCILVSTNLETAEIFEIEKEVVFTRDVRPPRGNEESFGTTLVGVPLTRESVSELVENILRRVIKRARLNIERDLHFVVRSTGVTACFSKPDEVGAIVKALANGCLAAGIRPRMMTASLIPENLSAGIRDFTWLKKVYFDGAIASSLPPANTEVVANEMEGELATAGIKGAAKSTDTDFRNPVMTLDFGTTLAGRVTDDNFPYSNTIGSFAGLGGAIPDALVRRTGEVNRETGCVLDVQIKKRITSSAETDDIEAALHLVRVEAVKSGTTRFGTVPVNPNAADESGVTLIGVDIGINGSKVDELEKVGKSAFERGGWTLLMPLVDEVQTKILQRIVTLAEEMGLITNQTSLGLTGRAITTGKKPSLIMESLHLSSDALWTDRHQLLFVEDGLAMGAAVAARCMNSMGTRHNPMGGRKGDRCIMGARIEKQRGTHDL